MDFEAFPKMARLSRDCVITEKLDGTNAQIFIERNDAGLEGYIVQAGSRNRWITPQDDNYGFAKWVEAHRIELIEGLGEGRHYGEWWGHGIQRNYGLTEKRFSLFNTGRWSLNKDCPKCCHVVPVIYQGPFIEHAWTMALDSLNEWGSFAAPGFMQPEGIVIWHEAARQLFKKTLENDSVPKGMAA